MSVNPPAGQPVYVQQVVTQNNGMGIAGFVLALVGFLTCGLLSPIGCIFSVIGLRKEPRGLAIAGLILGLIGSAWMVLGGLACVAGLVGIGVAAKEAGPAIRAFATVSDASSTINEYRQTHSGNLPSESTWRTIMQQAGKSVKDSWGHDLRYRQLEAGRFEVRSAGADGKFDTGDDITETQGAHGAAFEVHTGTLSDPKPSPGDGAPAAERPDPRESSESR